MKYSIAMVLLMSGCMTVSRAHKERDSAVADALEDSQMVDALGCKAIVAELTEAWLHRYCKMLLREELKYSKITRNNNIELPKACSKFLKSK